MLLFLVASHLIHILMLIHITHAQTSLSIVFQHCFFHILDYLIKLVAASQKSTCSSNCAALGSTGAAVVKNPPANAKIRVQSPVWEDPTCHRAPQPMLQLWVLWSPETTTTEAHGPWSPCSTAREAASVRNLCTTAREKPVQQQRPSAAERKAVLLEVLPFSEPAFSGTIYP